MFDLRHASAALKKAAYVEGIRVGRHNAWYKPVTDNERGVKAVVGDGREREIEITVFDLENVADVPWSKIKSGRW